MIFILMFVLLSCGSNGEARDTEIEEPKEVVADAFHNDEMENENSKNFHIESEVASEKEAIEREVKRREAKANLKSIEKGNEKVVENMPVEKEVEKVKTISEVEKKDPTQTIKVVANSQVDHDPWDILLRNNVSSTGFVNYSLLKKNIAKLDEYLESLSEHPPSAVDSRQSVMAYWINAYNAFTIKLILNNYPVNSIMDIHGGKAWDQKWIKLGGESYSLNQIEHDILRKRYPDARIHFAVNCAAKSCPPLLNRAWTESNLDSYLGKRTVSFINDASQNDISENKLILSKIFDWYRSDFGNLVYFIQKYTTKSVYDDAKVNFRDYDWDLNGK